MENASSPAAASLDAATSAWTRDARHDEAHGARASSRGTRARRIGEWTLRVMIAVDVASRTHMLHRAAPLPSRGPQPTARWRPSAGMIGVLRGPLRQRFKARCSREDNQHHDLRGFIRFNKSLRRGVALCGKWRGRRSCQSLRGIQAKRPFYAFSAQGPPDFRIRVRAPTRGRAPQAVLFFFFFFFFL